MSSDLLVRVTRKQPIALDVLLFELVKADDTVLPPFSAGSHIDVIAPGGLRRQYSLCNDASEFHRYEIAVLKTPNGRGGSLAMHESIQVGDEIVISAPKNHFPLAGKSRRSLLLAGGIGITPLLSMAERLSAIDHSFELHYCTRSPERTAFRDRIGSSRFARNVCFHFDDGAADQRLDLEALLRSPREGTHLYTCGPKGFMDAVLSAARGQGWSEDHLHYEFFNAEPLKLATDGSFEVQLASTGQVIPVASQQSVVAALAACGVQVATSCEQGVCGTCLTRVLEGEPDHRDLFLMPDEHAANKHFLPCCSRSKSARLVLDL